MKNYKDMIEAAFDHFALPSIAAGIYEAGEIKYYFYGEGAKAKSPPDEKTRYMIGSASKCFVSTSVCILASEGKIDLDAPVTAYLPDFKFYNDEMTEKITVRQILSHQSGLPRHDVTWVNNTDISLEQAVDYIKYLQPAYGIGERFHYQNHMYALASRLVEVISGMKWTDFVKERILDPLGMSRTWTDTFSFGKEGEGCAKPYAKMNGANIPWMIWHCDSLGGAASMTSTVEDELKWQIANLKGGFYGGVRIFDEQAEKELHFPQMPIKDFEMYGFPMEDIDVSECAYGLGWFIEYQGGEKVIHHGGTVGGFRSECGYIPDKDTAFVVFVNLDNTQATSAVQRAIVDIACGRAPKDWNSIYDAASEKAKKKSTAAVMPLLENTKGDFCDPSCEGVYTNPAYGKVKVSGSDDGSTRIWFLGQPLKMKIVSDDLLIIDALALANIAAPCRFIRKDGEVIALAAMLEAEIKDFIIFDKE